MFKLLFLFSSRLADEHHIISLFTSKWKFWHKTNDLINIYLVTSLLKYFFEKAFWTCYSKFPVQYLGLQVNNYDTSNHSVQYSGNIFLTWHIRMLLIIIQITFRYKISLRTLNNFRRMTLRSSLVMTGRYTDLIKISSNSKKENIGAKIIKF